MLRKPNHRDVAVGKTIPIVSREGVTKGKAKLIERRPSRYIQDGLPYIRHESPNGSPEEGRNETLYIWSYERWVVEWVEHPYHRPGDRTMEEVNYYVRTTTDQASFASILLDADGNPVVNTGGFGKAERSDLFIFIEEAGTLYLGKREYPDHVLQALKRVKRAINGNILLYGPDPDEIRHRWDYNKIPFRVLDYLPSTVTFGDAVTQYLKSHPWEDYVVLAGKSGTSGQRVITCGPQGLRLKNAEYAVQQTEDCEGLPDASRLGPHAHAKGRRGRPAKHQDLPEGCADDDPGR